MSKANGYYRRMAAECLHLADAMSDVDDRTLLLEIAQLWIRLDNHLRAKSAGETL
jgi:hypothetical protein